MWLSLVETSWAQKIHEGCAVDGMSWPSIDLCLRAGKDASRATNELQWGGPWTPRMLLTDGVVRIYIPCPATLALVLRSERCLRWCSLNRCILVLYSTWRNGNSWNCWSQGFQVITVVDWKQVRLRYFSETFSFLCNRIGHLSWCSLLDAIKYCHCPLGWERGAEREGPRRGYAIKACLK